MTGLNAMLMTEFAPFIEEFVAGLDAALAEAGTGSRLTNKQKYWLVFCLMGMLLTNSLCWAKFERGSLGKYKATALSWLFRKATIAWGSLLSASVSQVLRRHGISEGVLVVDESDRARSKRTARIHKTYKQKHKPSGGYVNGQTVVLLLLVSGSATFSVGAAFYMPDPALKAWDKEDKRLKAAGVAKADRPAKPARDAAYPTKAQIALGLLAGFRQAHGGVKVKAVLADALYGSADFMDAASQIFGGVQVVSQLHCNQNITYKGKSRTLDTYFNTLNPGVAVTMKVRGGKDIRVTATGARLKVDAHGKKRFVVALKYEGETGYRYLVATDMTWRALDILQTYSLRWLVEVFFEDWKLYEGWGREAKQLDEEGSSRGLILSLLFDHCLLLHPEQTARLKNQLPAYTVGSLQRKSQMDVLLAFIKRALEHPDPAGMLNSLAQMIGDVFKLMPSEKHLSGRDLGRMETTPSLKYRAAG
jgi:hypothetical protein